MFSYSKFRSFYVLWTNWKNNYCKWKEARRKLTSLIVTTLNKNQNPCKQNQKAKTKQKNSLCCSMNNSQAHILRRYKADQAP